MDFEISAHISARDGAGEGLDGDSTPLLMDELDALLIGVSLPEFRSATAMAMGLTGDDDLAIGSIDTVLSVSFGVDLVAGVATGADTVGATYGAFNTAFIAKRNIHP